MKIQDHINNLLKHHRSLENMEESIVGIRRMMNDQMELLHNESKILYAAWEAAGKPRGILLEDGLDFSSATIRFNDTDDNLPPVIVEEFFGIEELEPGAAEKNGRASDMDTEKSRADGWVPARETTNPPPAPLVTSWLANKSVGINYDPNPIASIIAGYRSFRGESK